MGFAAKRHRTHKSFASLVPPVSPVPGYGSELKAQFFFNFATASVISLR